MEYRRKKRNEERLSNLLMKLKTNEEKGLENSYDAVLRKANEWAKGQVVGKDTPQNTSLAKEEKKRCENCEKCSCQK